MTTFDDLYSAAHLGRWVSGGATRCPVCRTPAAEGGDCAYDHYDELGAPTTVDEARAALAAKEATK